MAKRKPPTSGRKLGSGAERASTLRHAAGILGAPVSWLHEARQAGCDGFKLNGNVEVAPVRAWIELHRAELLLKKDDLPLRDQKLVEEVRRLRQRNDRDAETLVEKAWVAERFQRVMGELNALRLRFEAEEPVVMATAGGDVELLRTHCRGFMDRLFAAMADCGKHFEA